MLPDYFFDLDAPYVVPFSLEHSLYLMSCVCIYLLTIRYRKPLAAHAESLRRGLLIVITLQQISQYTWYWMVYSDPLKEALPLQLCRVCSILTFLFLLTRNSRFMDLEFYFSFFALGAMVYPVGCYRLIHIDGISYMINHLVSLLAPLLAALVFGWRGSWQAYRRMVVAFSIYLPTVIWVNRLTGGNYFYLVERPFFHSLSPVAYILLVYTGTLLAGALITYLYTGLERRVLAKACVS